MNNTAKRLITKKWLESHHFKYDEKQKLWKNHFDYPDAYKTEYLKYDYENRVLYTQGAYVIGADPVCEMDEEKAYWWLRDVGYLFK